MFDLSEALVVVAAVVAVPASHAVKPVGTTPENTVAPAFIVVLSPLLLKVVNMHQLAPPAENVIPPVAVTGSAELEPFQYCVPLPRLRPQNRPASKSTAKA